MIKIYDIQLDNGDWVTVIAQSLRNALQLAEINGETAVDCKFVGNAQKIIIEKQIMDCGEEE